MSFSAAHLGIFATRPFSGTIVLIPVAVIVFAAARRPIG